MPKGGHFRKPGRVKFYGRSQDVTSRFRPPAKTSKRKSSRRVDPVKLEMAKYYASQGIDTPPSRGSRQQTRRRTRAGINRPVSQSPCVQEAASARSAIDIVCDLFAWPRAEFIRKLTTMIRCESRETRHSEDYLWRLYASVINDPSHQNQERPVRAFFMPRKDWS